MQQQGKDTEAIAAYNEAVTTLEAIRSSLLSANRDIQFDFRDTVDPLYRQLIALRLEQEDSRSAQHQVENSNLNAVLKTLDSLRLAELQNYFGNDCIIAPVGSANPVDSTNTPSEPLAGTAFFSSIVLTDRTAIIVRFPDGTEQFHAIEVSDTTLRQTINQYRIDAESFFKEFDATAAQQVYQWIIAPFAAELQRQQVKTLVFTQDGILRSVPMAALVNPTTQTYLIQDYAIAITPSLTLTDRSPFQRNRLRVLALGLTQEAIVDNQPFAELSNVEQETKAIVQELPGSKRLLNAEFTQAALTKELDRANYPIIHIATHGQFGTDAEETFLLTGDRQKLTKSLGEATGFTSATRKALSDAGVK